MKTIAKVSRKEKALVKDLELQIDFLVGYTPCGAHWKQEYHTRKLMIENTITSDETPPQIVEKILRIQDALYRLQNKQINDQPYLQLSTADYRPRREVPVKDSTGTLYHITL